MVSIHSFDWEIHITTNTVIYWESIVLFTDTKNAKQQTYLLLKLVLSLYWKWNLCWHLQIRMGWDGTEVRATPMYCFSQCLDHSPVAKKFCLQLYQLSCILGNKQTLFPDSEDGPTPLSPPPNSTFTPRFWSAPSNHCLHPVLPS